jgi:chemotaxis protein MotB
MAGPSDRRRGRGSLDAWPGYVDALSTLLMVIIFVLLVFVLAQGFLSVALTSRDRALDRLNRQVSELAELLALERGQAAELRSGLARATSELATAAGARDDALRSLGLLREERDLLATERDTARSEQERLAARLADLGMGARGTEDRVATLERQLAEAIARAERVGGDAARTTRDLTDTRRTLAQTEDQRAALERQATQTAADLAAARRDLEALRAEAAALNQQVTADRATIEARLADLARLNQQVQALTALREELERQAEAALARAGQEERARLAAEQAATRTAAERDEARRQREAAEGVAAAARTRADTSEAEARAAAQRAAEAEATQRTAEAAARDAVARAATAEQARQRAEDIARQAAAVQANAERARAEAEADAAARIAAAERARADADALRAQAEAQRTAATTAAASAQTNATEQTRLADSARAQVALLTRQIETLRAELARLVTALELEEAAGRDRDAQITNLGQRLNAALAARVEELQRYRSDFFGRLRQVLGERPEVRIVGDRFVFQGEVLFAPASADLSEAGQRQVRDLARVLLDVTPQIPPEIAWVIRVDGHADRTPIRSTRFVSNWELAAARAIAVAQLLIAEGLPANRVAATSFGDTQPIDDGETPAAYARNRRIEVRLTDR